MDDKPTPIEPHRSPEAVARRRRLGEQFDRAAVNGEEALKDALDMVEVLKQDPRWQTPPRK